MISRFILNLNGELRLASRRDSFEYDIEVHQGICVFLLTGVAHAVRSQANIVVKARAHAAAQH